MIDLHERFENACRAAGIPAKKSAIQLGTYHDYKVGSIAVRVLTSTRPRITVDGVEFSQHIGDGSQIDVIFDGLVNQAVSEIQKKRGVK
jgi:hypothetical protein